MNKPEVEYENGIFFISIQYTPVPLRVLEPKVVMEQMFSFDKETMIGFRDEIDKAINKSEKAG